MVDSGCSHDPVGEAEEQLCEQPISTKGPPMLSRTANGSVTTTKTLDARVEEMELGMSIFVLPNSPPLMSLGRRCLRGGFAFVWQACQERYFVRPDWMIIKLEAINDLPYFMPSTLRCQPAQAGSEI